MEVGSISIIEVQFNSTDDFSIEFYIERERSVKFKKEELMMYATSNGVRFYAVINSQHLGRGYLMCRAEVYDKDANIENRTVVLSGRTGIFFGACIYGTNGGFRCQEYSFTFKNVTNIPEGISGDLYYGVIKGWIEDYDSITEDMIIAGVENGNINVVNAQPINLDISVEEGDKLIVLIPYSGKARAKKRYVLNNNVSYNSEFNTEVMGANGDVTLQVKDMPYKIYGEFAILKGNKYIIIE